MEILVSDPNLRIDYSRCGESPKGLAYTFTALGFKKANGPGFGTEFLLKNGWDVVSFKALRNSWYQDVTEEMLEKAATVGQGYSDIVTYGSSMGGFAAVAFANALGATRAIAIAPQFSIWEDYDKRWRKNFQFIDQRRFEIGPESCSKSDVTILYDNRHQLDTIQVQHLRQTINPKRYNEVKLPFSSHSPAGFLKETGHLSTLVRGLLEGSQEQDFDFPWSRKRNSPAFLKSLGSFAALNDRPELARLCFERMAQLPKNKRTHAAHRYLSHHYEAQGNLKLAIAHAAIAGHIAPTREFYKRRLKSLLRASQSKTKTAAPNLADIPLGEDDED